MISALRKLARKNDEGRSRVSMPSGVASMGQSLQRKFARGVQYNMKIVIKGDRNTGKSTLLARCQGKAFKEEYIPTNEIQVCSINWSYKVADDVVKVEVWDVVDKGKKKKSEGDGLKLANEISACEPDQVTGVLDAEFLDVYKSTHGCIMMLDITKQWTFKYIQRELPKVPQHIPVLVLCNFLDMQEHRVVQKDEIQSFIKYFDRGKDSAIIHYGECCMKNGFGLKYIHKFFNIPFLKLQQETLEKQLEANKEDMIATLEELTFHQNTEEQDYDKFIAYAEKKTSDKIHVASKVESKSTSPRTTSIQTPVVITSKPDSSKKPVNEAQTIDDFVPEDTIDSSFLDETKNERKVEISEDSSGESENEQNPMVSGFYDISSEEENNIKKNSLLSPKLNSSFDVDIEITSDESDNETAVFPKLDHNGKKNTKNSTEPRQSLLLERKDDLMLNNQDDDFINAWLDSPSTDPLEVSVNEKADHELPIHDLDKLATNNLADTSEDHNKRHSQKKQRENNEEKQKHRSKHSKHKKKVKTKNLDIEGSTEKNRSKKKHRSKDVDYESF